MATENRSGHGLRFERWVLLAVVAIVSVTTAVVAIYSLGESARICRAVDRGNAGNRAAWAFMEVAARNDPDAPPAGSPQDERIKAFFDGIRERLKPVQC